MSPKRCDQCHSSATPESSSLNPGDVDFLGDPFPYFQNCIGCIPLQGENHTVQFCSVLGGPLSYLHKRVCSLSLPGEHYTAQGKTVLCCAILRCTLLCCALLCCAVLHCAVRFCTAMCFAVESKGLQFGTKTCLTAMSAIEHGAMFSRTP